MRNKPFIEIPSSLGGLFIRLEDIISIRSDDKSVFISLEDNLKMNVNLSIGRAEEILSQPYFVRCHRCHIINVLKIYERIKKKSSIKLVNGDVIPVSNKYKKQLEFTIDRYCNKVYAVSN